MTRIVIAAPTIVIALSLYYALVSLLGALRRPKVSSRRNYEQLYVFVVPCLDEAKVIGATLERLTNMEGPASKVVVVDDGSTDETAAIVTAFNHPDVHLFSRTLPEARQGKGKALNAAVRWLRTSPAIAGWSSSDVVVCIVDADGRLDPATLLAVAPLFNEQEVAGVQIAVRMINAADNLLARLQDLEFVAYAQVFQRSRTPRAIAGLGGNGQFTRLSALNTLGADPWTESLTEDLDLGLRLVALGWRTAFCGSVAVRQQAITDARRLLRQRTRWFQGHLQALERIPMLINSDLPLAAVTELIFILALPIAVVCMSLFGIGVSIVALGSTVVGLFNGTYDVGVGTLRRLAALYALTFGPSWIYGYVYWLHTSPRRLWRAVVDAHALVGYQYLWLISGLRAIGRAAVQRNDWAKTARLPDTTPVVGEPVRVGR